MLVSEFFDTVYLPMKLRSSSENTVRLYRYSVRKYGTYLTRPAELTDLNDLSVSRYLQDLGKQNLSPYTVDKERSQLLAIWNFAAKKKYVSDFPFVDRDRLPERIPQAWMKDDLTKLVASCKAQEGYISGVKACDWWLALHKVIWDSGERIGAVLSIEWAWIKGEWLSMPAESRKGKTRDKLFALTDETLESLAAIKEPKRIKVFVWDRAPTHIYYHYRRILERAGLSTDCKSKFHRMRKTVASFFQAAGGDASELLDHSSPRTTKAYLDPRIVVKSQAKDLLFKLE